MQKTISQQWIHQKVKPDDEITHEEMLGSGIRAHLREFEKPPRARWEELMVRLSKYPSSEAAYAALAAMGNEVALAGRPLAEVAKARSDGPTAADGGARDWTNQGSLAAEQLDRALFALPPGRLSPILESKTGLHIIRVLEREGLTRDRVFRRPGANPRENPPGTHQKAGRRVRGQAEEGLPRVDHPRRSARKGGPPLPGAPRLLPLKSCETLQGFCISRYNVSIYR